ncbi:alpha/beta hydrolase [Amycolatopsis pittospori]|uniref:hypothetical protein n=1 Tax=Amycolatopsis pittospori TaxID=2749434 RepID=UPI001F3C7D86|nr:hypothetical protein [Amycolatopsis pittospori]
MFAENSRPGSRYFGKIDTAHIGATGHSQGGGGFRGAITAWFRFWLSGGERARGEFFGPSCGLCRDGEWSDVQRNAKAPAVSGA